MKFCEDCGSPLDSNHCIHCHNLIDSNLALCPHCGKPVQDTSCSFCGASIELNEKFCPDCGNSRDGIICPDCGTLNFRSFCRKCNTPLNDMALIALDKVRKNPLVIRSSQLAREMEELEQQITLMVQQMDENESDELPLEAETSLDTSNKLTEEDRNILNRYKELFSDFSINKPIGSIDKPLSNIENPKKGRTKFNIDNNLLQSAVEEYRAKAEEMQSLLDAMIPDPNDTPEEQRNFFCACKMETYSNVKSTKTERVGWVCNLCGCRHSQPSECARPELGGTWLYEEVEVIKRVTNFTTLHL